MQTIRRLESLENDLIAERHARIDDLALLVDLISSGWSGIDVRLARMERKLDTGGIVSFSIWETEGEAEDAVAAAASWVEENLADRISLRELHTGDLELDEDA